MIRSTSEEAKEHQKARTPKQTQGLILGTWDKLTVILKKISWVSIWGKNCSGLLFWLIPHNKMSARSEELWLRQEMFTKPARKLCFYVLFACFLVSCLRATGSQDQTCSGWKRLWVSLIQPSTQTEVRCRTRSGCSGLYPGVFPKVAMFFALRFSMCMSSTLWQ